MAIMYKSVKGASAVQPTGNAVEADVLASKTFSNSSGTGKTGTMPNNGAVSATVEAGQSYTIPLGYHNGSGTVTGSGAQVSNGSSETTSGSNTKVTLGFKPKELVIVLKVSNQPNRIYYYNETVDTTQYLTAAGSALTYDAFGSSIYKIVSIDNDGFTVANMAGYPIDYFAVS